LIEFETFGATGTLLRKTKGEVVDWEQPANNDFPLVNQFSVTGALYTCRPDLIGFVNGLPLERFLRQMSLCEMTRYATMQPVMAMAQSTRRFSGRSGLPATSSYGWKKKNGESQATRSRAGVIGHP
jgi:hypothetical protein